MVVGAGGAELAAVGDEAIGEQYPFFLREQAHEILLDFVGVGIASESQEARQAPYMGVYRDADCYAIGILQDNVCGFASDARKHEQFIHGARHFVIEF